MDRESQPCTKCGYNSEYERSMAFAAIERLQNSIQTMGLKYSQMNITMVQVKNENLILKEEIKMLNPQRNEKVQGGRKKKKKNQSVV